MSHQTPAAEVECYRCGARIAAERIDLERWIVLDSWNPTTLYVCRACQRSDERRIADEVNRGSVVKQRPTEAIGSTYLFRAQAARYRQARKR